jgi:hypothetical protein
VPAELSHQQLKFWQHYGVTDDLDPGPTPTFEPAELRLTVSGGNADAHLLSLRDWLVCEDELRGQLKLLAASPQPGHMGTIFDVLTVALGSGSAGAVLARSLSTWLVQRRADVKVTAVATDGSRIEVDVKRAADPARVIAEVNTLLLRGREQ